MSKSLLAFAVSLLLASVVPWAPSAAQNKAVEVDNAWARATPGKAETGAAYVTLKAASADRLIGAATPVAKKAELHTMTMEDGVMKMRPLTGIDLPAGQAVTLKPGAMHIMLLGLTAPLHAGQSFPVTLQFEKAGTETVNVSVEQIGAMGPQGEGDGHMSMPMPAHH